MRRSHGDSAAYYGHGLNASGIDAQDPESLWMFKITVERRPHPKRKGAPLSVACEEVLPERPAASSTTK